MTTSDLAPQDAELIAAFIDRRLPKEERQAFLERLDSEEALYEVFVETVRYRDEASAKPANVLEHSAWRKQWTLPAAIAALLALAVATPLLIRTLSDKSYAEMLVADGRLDPHLSEGWYEQPWSRMRGISPGTDEANTAFRIGVRVVDLGVALRAGKLGDASILTSQIENLLGGIELSKPLRISYTQLFEDIEQDVNTEHLIRRAESNKKLVKDYLPDLAPAYQFGSWAETGKLAARSGNGRLLTSRPFRQQLGIFQRAQSSDLIAPELERIENLLSTSRGQVDLRGVEEAFGAIIKES